MIIHMPYLLTVQHSFHSHTVYIHHLARTSSRKGMCDFESPQYLKHNLPGDSCLNKYMDYVSSAWGRPLGGQGGIDRRLPKVGFGWPCVCKALLLKHEDW
jgi:hypothetical protein